MTKFTRNLVIYSPAIVATIFAWLLDVFSSFNLTWPHVIALCLVIGVLSTVADQTLPQAQRANIRR